MRTTIKAKVHLLATDNDNPTQVSIMRLPQKNKLYSHVVSGEFRRGLQMGHQPQHLYFTTDEKIKEGDYFFTCHITGILINSIIYNAGSTIVKNQSFQGHYIKKIVATTDPELWKTKWTSGEYEPSVPFQSISQGIPKIDIPFIEAYIKAYNEGKQITEVLLEQERIYQQYEEPKGIFNKNPDKLVLKLKSNGSVTVHPVKERMFTRTEVEKIIDQVAERKAFNQRFNQQEWFNKE